MDEFELRANEGRVRKVRLRLRLGTGNLVVRAGILSLEPVAVSAHAGEGSRLSQTQPRELVSPMPDSSGERTSSRRLLLAPRNHHGGTEGNRAMVPAHHALF